MAVGYARPSMEVRYSAGTDAGRKRSANEDNFLVDEDLNLFIVADGMGGHASGEVASAMAVHTVHDVISSERDVLDGYDDDDPRSHVEICTLLEYSVHRACELIHEKAKLEPEKRGMGTTIVVLLIIGARGFIAYVGDSRIYLLRGEVVYQLTEDHSIKNELIRMGKVRADEFDQSPYAKLKNAMTRAVGVYESVEVDTLDFDVIPDDTFLLCSDGLYEYLDENDIERSLALPELQEVPGKLIEVANTRGGKDNITALVAQLTGDAADAHRATEINFTLEMLRKVPLFKHLSYQQLVRIMNVARQTAITPGQRIFEEGDRNSELCVVLRGVVHISKGGVLVSDIGAGGHFGEMALIDAAPRSTTAIAAENGRLLTVKRSDFLDILRSDPPLAVKLLWSFVRALSDRLRTTTAELSEARNGEVVDLTSELSEETVSLDDLFEL